MPEVKKTVDIDFDLAELDLDAVEIIPTGGYLAIPETGASCSHTRYVWGSSLVT